MPFNLALALSDFGKGGSPTGMADIQAQIKQAQDQLKRATEDLAIWESFDSVTVTDERGKSFSVRSEMITRCKLNIQRDRVIIAALETRAERPS